MYCRVKLKGVSPGSPAGWALHATRLTTVAGCGGEEVGVRMHVGVSFAGAARGHENIEKGGACPEGVRVLLYTQYSVVTSVGTVLAYLVLNCE